MNDAMKLGPKVIDPNIISDLTNVIETDMALNQDNRHHHSIFSTNKNQKKTISTLNDKVQP